MCTNHTNPQHAALRDRLWAHPLEHADQARDLVRRLAMEHGWTLTQAREAVEEYRRFCFLAVVGGHAVTPSDEVLVSHPTNP